MKSTAAPARPVDERGAESERRDRERRGEREQRAATPTRAQRAASRRLERLGRRAGGDEQVVHALEPRPLARLEVGADELVEVGPHRSSSSSASASRASALRVRVFTVPSGIPSRSAISLWESPRQYASSMTGRSCSGSTSSARWTRQAVHDASASSDGIGLATGAVLELGDRLGRAAQAVRDRVPGDGVEPRRAATARRVVRARGAPDRDEGLLRRVLGATAVAEAAQREPEHRARVAAVQLVERAAVAAGDAHDQLAVGRLGKLHERA